MTPQEGKTAPTPSKEDVEAAEAHASSLYPKMQFAPTYRNGKLNSAWSMTRSAYLVACAHKEKQLAEAVAKARAEAFTEAAENFRTWADVAMGDHEMDRCEAYSRASDRMVALAREAQQAPGEERK